MKMNRKSENKEGDPLHFTDAFKWQLELQLRLNDNVKYLRWYKEETYLRFKIFDESYKIIVSESHHPFDEQREYQDGAWVTRGQLPVYYDGTWVVDAIRFYNSTNAIMRTCININNYLFHYDTKENIDKMIDFANSLNIEPTSFDYDYIKREDGGFSISYSDEYEILVDDFTRSYMAHLGLKRDKYGALFQVIKVLAHSIFDRAIDEQESDKATN